MHYALTFFAGSALALCLCLTPALGDEADDLATQILHVSQTQDPATQAEVKKVVTENQGVIKTILETYAAQLKQVQALTSDAATAETKSEKTASTADSENTKESNTGKTEASAGRTSGLQTSELQPAGSLQMSHLAGYPSLPAVDPTSSILNPTPAQLAHKAELDAATRKRKEFFREHPGAYHYP